MLALSWLISLMVGVGNADVVGRWAHSPIVGGPHCHLCCALWLSLIVCVPMEAVLACCADQMDRELISDVSNNSSLTSLGVS